MGDWIKRGVFLALVGAAGWKGWTYWKGRDVAHQLVFHAEGPTSCRVQIRHEAGASLGNESTTLEWQSDPVDTRGHVNAVLSVEIPLSCAWQPSQVHCAIDRDGVAWKQAETQWVHDPRDGTPSSLRCSIEANVNE